MDPRQLLQALMAGQATQAQPAMPNLQAQAIQRMMVNSQGSTPVPVGDMPDMSMQKRITPGMKNEDQEMEYYRQKGGGVTDPNLGKMTPEQSREGMPRDLNAPPDSTEGELKSLQDQYDKGGESDPKIDGVTDPTDENYTWQGTDSPTPDDLDFLRNFPTDGNIQDFIDTYGEDALPSDMKNPEGEDYVRGT